MNKWTIIGLIGLVALIVLLILNLVPAPVSKECAYFCQGNKSLMIDIGNYCIDCSKIC